MIDPDSDEDIDGPELFIAHPTDEIPRNKLVEKLARGLQAYVQRMQKRESFYVTVKKQVLHKWQPAPRECATLTAVRTNAYLLGGLNQDANNEIAKLSIKNLESPDIEKAEASWQNVAYVAQDNLQGRCRHTSCAYNNKIYTFGGCYKFNSKR